MVAMRQRYCPPVANTGAARWMESENPEAGDGLFQKASLITTAIVSYEAPPDQFCPSELVQLGPLPLGGSRTPSGQLLDRR